MDLTARLTERRVRIEARLRSAAERAGRDPDGVRILAVTKTWPVRVARSAFSAGLRRLGENRVQEAVPKIEALPEAEWHLVGRLQSNKARRAVSAFAVIHSIDSLELLRRVESVAADERQRPRVLLQVNLSGEPTKAGFDATWFEAEARHPGELARALAAMSVARPVGLMTIGRLGASDDEARVIFRRLRQLRDLLQEASGIGLPELSMGMTDDMEAAAAEGATLVRIGTALFGRRSA